MEHTGITSFFSQLSSEAVITGCYSQNSFSVIFCLQYHLLQHLHGIDSGPLFFLIYLEDH